VLFSWRMGHPSPKSALRRCDADTWAHARVQGHWIEIRWLESVLTRVRAGQPALPRPQAATTAGSLSNGSDPFTASQTHMALAILQRNPRLPLNSQPGPSTV
jgi:hypothetical protein